MSRFIQSTFPGDEDLRVDVRRTFWTIFVNTAVTAVEKGKIGEDIARYWSTMRLTQDYSEEDGTHGYVAR